MDHGAGSSQVGSNQAALLYVRRVELTVGAVGVLATVGWAGLCAKTLNYRTFTDRCRVLPYVHAGQKCWLGGEIEIDSADIECAPSEAGLNAVRTLSSSERSER